MCDRLDLRYLEIRNTTTRVTNMNIRGTALDIIRRRQLELDSTMLYIVHGEIELMRIGKVREIENITARNRIDYHEMRIVHRYTFD